MNKQEILKILDEILDEIQAMLTEEQGAKESNTMKKSKWTFVNDRMPNRGEVVLTVRIRRHMGKPYIAMDVLSADNQWVYAMQDITVYWQPLPELPKELRREK